MARLRVGKNFYKKLEIMLDDFWVLEYHPRP
jgi:hypothetical protein